MFAMRMTLRRPIKTGVSLRVLVAFAAFVIPYAPAQQRNAESQLAITRNAREKELESIAIIERKVMVPMRDGKRMAADIYRPKDTSKKYPIIFVRTPYNFNFWDVKNGRACATCPPRLTRSNMATRMSR